MIPLSGMIESAIGLIRDLLRIFVPDSDEAKKRHDFKSKEGFKEFVKKSDEDAHERQSSDYFHH